MVTVKDKQGKVKGNGKKVMVKGMAKGKGKKVW